MALPQMMKQALQAAHRDESLRLVYPANDIRIEQSSDPKILIATFVTADGFEISLGLTHEQLTIFNLASPNAEGEVGDNSTNLN